MTLSLTVSESLDDRSPGEHMGLRQIFFEQKMSMLKSLYIAQAERDVNIR